MANFLEVWRRESESTARVLGALSDEALSYRAHHRSRSAGELGWHIVTAVREIGEHAGLEVSGTTPLHAPVGTVESYRPSCVSVLGQTWLVLHKAYGAWYGVSQVR